MLCLVYSSNNAEIYPQHAHVAHEEASLSVARNAAETDRNDYMIVVQVAVWRGRTSRVFCEPPPGVLFWVSPVWTKDVARVLKRNMTLCSYLLRACDPPIACLRGACFSAVLCSIVFMVSAFIFDTDKLSQINLLFACSPSRPAPMKQAHASFQTTICSRGVFCGRLVGDQPTDGAFSSASI